MELLQEARQAISVLTRLNDAQLNGILVETANSLTKEIEGILQANQEDLDRMDQNDPKYDRLKLTAERIEGIATDIRHVANLPSPLGKVLTERVHPNGINITKVSVPFGVIGVIYEARPNVTVDVFSLCLKSGNVCVLKGSHDAYATNRFLVDLIQKILKHHNLAPAICTLLPPDKETTLTLLNATRWVDLIIPRGSQGLIQYVRDNAKVPVIETGAGICHTYFDEYGDREKGQKIIFNAKTRRVSVCNALDCLIIHKQRLKDLPHLCELLKDKKVILYADKQAYRALEEVYPKELLRKAEPEHFGMEFLDYKMSVRTVANVDQALTHINQHSSRHSEAIVSENADRLGYFQQMVDAACVYTNVSTAFTDGAQFGLGAEIGISTQKLHARGPMGLEELTSYKYLITGSGQTREDS